MSMVKQGEYFFDCHCHTMTLGHINISSFLENLVRNSDLEILMGIVGGNAGSTSKKPSSLLHNTFNLLTLMQNDLADIFFTMEDDLKGLFGGSALADDEGLHLNGREYQKLVLTPLIMDFMPLPGVKSMTYFPQPTKELRTVINDYSFAIKQYYRERPKGLLYILPFLGINPAVHGLKELERIIEDSFGFYKARWLKQSVRGSGLLTWLAGHISPEKMFAGIKLYPPMGFDPWPEDQVERMKVEMLYTYAQEASIPITTHCNDGGFITVEYDQANRNTSPATWETVLKRYPGLKLNFAHAGVSTTLQFPVLFGKKEKTWTEIIFDLMEKYENVYTDFSFNGISPKFYETFLKELEEMQSRDRLQFKERVLFGSDFMINLMAIRSYRDYYQFYEESPIPADLRHAFGSRNPLSFLNLR